MPDNWKEQPAATTRSTSARPGWPGRARPRLALGLAHPVPPRLRQYVNLRPVKLMPGIPCPLAGRKPGDIDYFVVRENTEGEYSSVGGRMFEAPIGVRHPAGLLHTQGRGPDHEVRLRGWL